MRLANFILANIEPILVDWVRFARTITPEKDIAVLRDHAGEILRATAEDMIAPQTVEQRSDKSKGHGDETTESQILDSAAADFAVERVDSGFDLMQLVSEYRALRVSVIRLWSKSLPNPVLHDLDDLTRFNEAIDQSIAEAVYAYTKRVDESRKMFLTILGHDLRAPLATMKLAGYVLGQNKDLDAQSSKLARELGGIADQMEQMLLDLLDYSATRLGQSIPIVTAEMDLGMLCRKCVTEMQAAHPSRTIRCTLDGDLSGTWDSGRLWQVVSILLSNAIQYGAQHTPVELSVTGDATGVAINVHNAGNPIPPDRLSSLFNAMSRRSEPGTALRPGSVGLGLYIVREIVAAHAGSVDVKSSQEAGTDFTVQLPRQPAPVA